MLWQKKGKQEEKITKNVNELFRFVYDDSKHPEHVFRFLREKADALDRFSSLFSSFLLLRGIFFYSDVQNIPILLEREDKSSHFIIRIITLILFDRCGKKRTSPVSGSRQVPELDINLIFKSQEPLLSTSVQKLTDQRLITDMVKSCVGFNGKGKFH